MDEDEKEFAKLFPPKKEEKKSEPSSDDSETARLFPPKKGQEASPLIPPPPPIEPSPENPSVQQASYTAPAQQVASPAAQPAFTPMPQSAPPAPVAPQGIDVGATVRPMIQGGISMVQNAASDYQKDPVGSLNATTSMLPAGMLGMADTALNVGNAGLQGLGIKGLQASNMEQGYKDATESINKNKEHEGAAELGALLGSFGIPAAAVNATLMKAGEEGAKALPKLLLPVARWFTGHPKVAGTLFGAGSGAAMAGGQSISQNVQQGQPPNMEQAKQAAVGGGILGGGIGLGLGTLHGGKPAEAGAGTPTEGASSTPAAEPVEVTPEAKAKQEDLERKRTLRKESAESKLRKPILDEQIAKERLAKLERERNERQSDLDKLKESAETATAEGKINNARQQADNQTELQGLNIQIKRIQLERMQKGGVSEFDENYQPPSSIAPDEDNIELEDGSKFSPEDLSAVVADPSVPEDVRKEAAEALKEHVLETRGRVKPNEETNVEHKETKDDEPKNAKNGDEKVSEDESGQKGERENADAVKYTFEKADGGHNILEDGKVVRFSKDGEKAVTQRVKDLNEGKAKIMPQRSPLKGGVSKSVMADESTPALQADMEDLADTKHSLDEKQAVFDSAYDAYREKFGVPPYEKLTRERNNRETSDKAIIKVTNANKPNASAPEYRPQGNGEGNTEYKQALLGNLEGHYDALSAATKNYKIARGKVEPQYLGAKLGTTEIPHEKGSIKIEPTTVRANAESFAGADKPATRSMPHIRKWLKEFVEREEGSAEVGYPIDVVASAIHQGKMTIDQFKALWDTSKSFDAAARFSPTLERDLKYGMQEELEASHNVKFAPEEMEAADKALRLSQDDLLTDEDVQEKFGDDPKKMHYLMTRKIIRDDLADRVQETMDDINDEHADENGDLPPAMRDDYARLDRLQTRLRGGSPFSGSDNAADRLITGGTSTMYDYLLKDSPPFNALVRLHNTQVLPLRVGLKNAAAASKLLATDSEVSKYFSGYTPKGLEAEIRGEAGGKSSPEGKTLMAYVEKLVPGPLKPTLSPYLRTTLMDQMNWQDGMVSGIIEHGENIKYPGGGVQLAKDIVADRAPSMVKIDAMVNGLDAVNKTTGMGYMGLNPDVIQDSKYGRFLTLFTSQRYRVLTLQKQYIKQAMRGTEPEREAAVRKLLAFTALTVAVGGHAVLPKEVDLLENVEAFKGPVRALKDLLDVPAESLGVGTVRDVSDKIQNSLIPGMGGITANLIADEFGAIAKHVDRKDWKSLIKSIAILKLSQHMGGGGATINRLANSVANVAKSDKAIYPMSDSLVPMFNHPIGKSSFSKIEGKPYDIGAAAMDNFIPGVTPKTGAYIKDMRRKHEDKAVAI